MMTEILLIIIVVCYIVWVIYDIRKR